MLYCVSIDLKGPGKEYVYKREAAVIQTAVFWAFLLAKGMSTRSRVFSRSPPLLFDFALLFVASPRAVKCRGYVGNIVAEKEMIIDYQNCTHIALIHF